ncbi:hypothetical protein HK405_006963 [Cladochytrium tenue]|nr:hypothetical protein HK405_006963 [Cladochytrium tenue]
MKTFVSDVKIVSKTSTFDLPAFVAKAKLDKPLFDVSTVFPASEDAPKVLQLFSKTVKVVGPENFGKNIYTVLGQSTTSTADAATVLNRFLRNVSLVSPPESKFDLASFETVGKELNPKFESSVFLERLLLASPKDQSPTATTITEISPTKLSNILQVSRIPPNDAAPGSPNYNRLMKSLTGIDSSSALPSQSAEKVIFFLEDAIKSIGVEAFLAGLPTAQKVFEESSARAPSPVESIEELDWSSSLPRKAPTVIKPPAENIVSQPKDTLPQTSEGPEQPKKSQGSTSESTPEVSAASVKPIVEEERPIEKVVEIITSEKTLEEVTTPAQPVVGSSSGPLLETVKTSTVVISEHSEVGEPTESEPKSEIVPEHADAPSVPSGRTSEQAQQPSTSDENLTSRSSSLEVTPTGPESSPASGDSPAISVPQDVPSDQRRIPEISAADIAVATAATGAALLASTALISRKQHDGPSVPETPKEEAIATPPKDESSPAGEIEPKKKSAFSVFTSKRTSTGGTVSGTVKSTKSDASAVSDVEQPQDSTGKTKSRPFKLGNIFRVESKRTSAGPVDVPEEPSEGPVVVSEEKSLVPADTQVIQTVEVTKKVTTAVLETVPSVPTTITLDQQLTEALPAEDKQAVEVFASELNSVTSPGWWSRLVNTVKEYCPDFSPLLFVDGLASIPQTDHKTVDDVFVESGAPLSPDDRTAVNEAVCPGNPADAQRVFTTVAVAANKLGPKTFVETALPAVGENSNDLLKSPTQTVSSIKVVKKVSSVAVETKPSTSYSVVATTVPTEMKVAAAASGSTKKPEEPANMTPSSSGGSLAKTSSTSSLTSRTSVIVSAASPQVKSSTVAVVSKTPSSSSMTSQSSTGSTKSQVKTTAVVSVSQSKTATSPVVAPAPLIKRTSSVSVTTTPVVKTVSVAKSPVVTTSVATKLVTTESATPLTKATSTETKVTLVKPVTKVVAGPTVTSISKVSVGAGSSSNVKGEPSISVVNPVVSGIRASRTLSTSDSDAGPLSPEESGSEVSSASEKMRRSFMQTLVQNVEGPSATGYVPAATLTRVRKTSRSHARPESFSPEHQTAASKFILSTRGIARDGWWTRLVETVTKAFPEFNPEMFVTRLSSTRGPVTNESLVQTFKDSGANITPAQYLEIQQDVATSPENSVIVFNALANSTKDLGPSVFYHAVLPIALKSNLIVEELDLNEALKRITLKRPEAKFDLFGFLNECQLLSPSFDITSFLEALSSTDEPITDEKILANLKFAGLDVSVEEAHRLLTILFGSYDFDWIWDWVLTLRQVGVFELLLGFPDVSEDHRPTQEQVVHSCRAFVTSVYDMGPRSKFDFSSFQNACRGLNPAFNVETFLQKLSLEENPTTETLQTIFKASGLSLTDEELQHVMVALCGDESIFANVIKRLGQFLRVWGVSTFLEAIDGVTIERKEKIRLMRAFLDKVYSLGDQAQFNLRGFVQACQLRDPAFDLRKFCDHLAGLQSVETDTLHECFVMAGIDIDPLSTEYSDLLHVLFGDVDLAMAAAREWRYYLKSAGMEWSMFTMWSVVDQREQAETSVRSLLSELQTLTASRGSRFTLRIFVERCKSLQLGWNSGQEFDLRIFLDKLSHLEGDVNFASLVGVFKACGINTTVEEYEQLIGSIAGENYNVGLDVFRIVVPFIRSWGSEWSTWIIWSLLDDKEANEATIEDFLLKVAKIDKSARFNLLEFVERCESVENSWHAAPFNIQTFVDNLTAIEGEVTFEKLTEVFRASGIRTTFEEYRHLIATLGGGDFDTGVRVFGEWIGLLRLWGVEWFFRTSTTFFEKQEESSLAIDEFEATMATQDQKVDLRSFYWACQVRNPEFSLNRFLTLLISAKGELEHDFLKSALYECGIGTTDDEFTALVGLLTIDDPTLSVLKKWVSLIRKCGVQTYIYLMRWRWIWDSASIDARLALQAFTSRIQYSYSASFDLAKLNEAAESHSTQWDIRLFIRSLLTVKTEISIGDIVRAFKDAGVNVTEAQAKDVLNLAFGTREHAVDVIRQWVDVLRVISVDQALGLASEVTIPAPVVVETETTTVIVKAEEEKPAATSSKEGWFSRAIRVVGEGAQVVTSTALHAGEAVVQAGENILLGTSDKDTEDPEDKS